jgi:hypothetical protein
MLEEELNIEDLIEHRVTRESGADLGFISRYADWADVIEVPRMMHEIVATQLVAAVLNRNEVVIPHGGLKYPLDLWVVLLSGSGQGRSTLAGMPRPLLEASGLPDIVRNTEWGSLPAFYQDMAKHASGLFVWGELSQKFKLLNDARFGGLKEWITDRYDNFQIPEARVYRKTGNKGDTPSIEFAKSPRTNILATSSLDWFFRNIEQGDSAGGFIPRWLLVRAEGQRRYIPTPKSPDSREMDRLATVLKGIADLKGEADLTDILPLYEEWYVPTMKRFESQPNALLAGAYVNRHRVHILKLAVIYEVARSCSLRVSKASWWCAVATARKLEETIFSLLGTGMSSYGYKQGMAEELIQKAGSGGLLRSEFTRAFQHDPPRDREAWLHTLIQAERVKTDQRPTAGRTATFLIHRDFWGETLGKAIKAA